MKVFKLIPFLMICALGFSQTAEEVLDKASEAVGGKSAANIKSMVTAGTVTMMGTIKADLVSYFKESGKILVVTKVDAPGMSMEVIQGCDGTDCYSKDPNFGTRLLEGQEKEMMLLNNDFKSQMDWRSVYDKVEYKGESEFEGRKVYKVYVQSNAGMSMTNEYDAETYMLLRSKGKTAMQLGTMEFVIKYTDYKNVHENVKMPMKMETVMMNQNMMMTINEVNVNVDIPDDKFKLPEGLK